MNQLLNKIDQEDHKQVFEKDMLFATLETSVRQISLPDNKSFLLTDTVGFVSKLPHHLVKAFRSTLEEARDADLLLHVVDASNDENQYMMEITNNTLQAVGVEDIPTLYVFNKSDLANLAYPYVNNEQIWISAKEGKGIDELLELIRKHIFSNYVTCTLCIPFERGDIVSYMNEHAHIMETSYDERGTIIEVELHEAIAEKYKEFWLN